MRNITLSIFTAVLIFTAVSCNQNSNQKEETNNSSDTSMNGMNHSKGMSDEAMASAQEKMENKEQVFSIAPIITDYLSLKNALVSDDDKGAANAGKKLFATLNNVDMKSIPADKHQKYMDIADDAKEHAEHIEKNVGNIEHQREHLASLGEDLKDLIDLFGTSQTLYQDHCPMFNEGKGAVWLSETKEIKNPYYGSKMISCGSVKKQY